MSEQEPSRFESIKQGIHGIKEAVTGGIESLQSGIDSMREGARRIKAIGKIAAIGVGANLAFAGAVSAEEPMHVTNQPFAEATASDLQQDCVDAGLKVDVLKSEMFRPGDPKSQSMISRASLQPYDACLQAGLSRENPTVTFQIENPNKPNSYITVGKPQGLKGPKGPLGNQGGTGDAYIAPVFAIKNPKYRYRCTPGKGVTDVRAIYHTQVNGPDGNKLAEKDRTVRVRVRPVHGPLEHKGAVRRAC